VPSGPNPRQPIQSAVHTAPTDANQYRSRKSCDMSVMDRSKKVGAFKNPERALTGRERALTGPAVRLMRVDGRLMLVHGRLMRRRFGALENL
jgi:hypothetical protein